MPYKTKQSAKQSGFPTTAEGIALNLVQINKLASIYDAIKESGNVKNPMAVAWTQWKRLYKKVGDNWEKKANEPIINPIELEFAEPTKEIEILKTGEWDHPSYGPIKITDKDLDDFVKNFNKKIRNDLPINIEHKTTEGAVGWFKKIIKKGKSLFAKVEWTTKGRQLLKDKVFKYFSPEFYSTYDDPETRKIYKNVLVGGALTNTPYFKGLKAIVFSELIEDMNLKEILEKEVKDLTDKEKETLKKHKEQLTDEQAEKFKKVFEEEEETEEEETEENTEEENTEEQTNNSEEEEEENEEKVEMSEAKLRLLERNAKEGVKAMAELRRQKAQTFAESMTLSKTNSDGLILPKSQDKVVDFLLSLNSEQAEKFKEIIGELPKPDSGIFGEVGLDQGNDDSDTSDQVNKLVEGKMKDNDKLSYRDALDLVMAENPNLANQL